MHTFMVYVGEKVLESSKNGFCVDFEMRDRLGVISMVIREPMAMIKCADKKVGAIVRVILSHSY